MVCFVVSIKEPAKAAVRPPDAAAPHEAQHTGVMPMASPEPHGATISASDGGRSSPRASTTASGESLLTPRDILTRLNLTSADPAKWMRRTFAKHGVPYVRASGKVRATERQYQMLLEKITYSPFATVGRTAFTISKAQSRSAISASTSKSSVQERVTRMLRHT